jgi:predicted dehydrogenase
MVGIGNISGIYLRNLTGTFKDRVKVTAVTGNQPERAVKAAAEYSLSHLKTADELLNSPDVDIVLNLTHPSNHYPAAMASVKAGKHIYSEKPLCVRME